MLDQTPQGQQPQQDETITWVGEQRLMHGYCGRAVVTVEATPTADVIAAPPLQPVPQRRRTTPAVIRIGPKLVQPLADDAVAA